jgi:glycosyltransferase involved in cell wall biosynthesis
MSNEKKTAFEITVVSSYNAESYKLSQGYTHTKFFFIKHNKLLDGVDAVINFAFGLVDSSRKLRKCNFLYKLEVIRKCQKLITEKNYDAVVLENHGYLTKIFDSEELLSKYKGKIYYHLHNDIPESVSEKVIRESKIILISKYLEKKIIAKYGDETRKNMLILNNGISVEKYRNRISAEDRDNLRKELGFKKNDKVVCFVGRINPTKGILELLQAIQKIEDKSIKLLVIGATEFGNNAKSQFEEKIKVLCSSLGSRVRLTGYVPHEDVWKYYQTADLAALPSVWEEPAGLTILEAMASRLPVITTNAGGIPEFMRSEYGYILERDKYLVNNIKKSIIAVCQDLNVWEEKGKLAQLYVATNYSEDDYFNNFTNLINGDLED